jgi:hypothetical protein
MEKPTLFSAWERLFGMGLLIALICYLAWVASYLQIDYFDTFSNYLNSKCMAALSPEGYYWKRPLFLPLVLSPLFLLENLTGWELFAFTASHLLAVLFYALLVHASYRLYRLHLAPETAFWGAGLLALNLLLIHHAPFAKEDIPATLLVTLTFYHYLTLKQGAGWLSLARIALLAALAMAARYNLIPLLVLVLALGETQRTLTSFLARKSFLALFGPVNLLRFFFLLLLPVALFMALPLVLYPALGLAAPLEAPRQFIRELILQYQLNLTPENPTQNYIFLWKSASPPVILCFLAGIATSWKQKRPGVGFHTLWFLVFFIAQTYVIAVKEARYLFPLYPAFYYFVAAGLEKLMRVAPAGVQNTKIAGLLRLLVLALVVILPLKNAAAETARFRDPVYRVNFEREVSLYASRLAGPNRIFWIGPYYPVHPVDYLFDREDSFTSVFHFYNHVIRFYTGKPARAVVDATYDLPAGESGPAFVGPNIAGLAGPGDVLVVNLEPSPYSAEGLPPSLKPLLVQRLRTMDFARDSAQPRSAAELYVSSGTRGMIAPSLGPEGFTLQGEGLPNGFYEIYVTLPKLGPLPFGRVAVRNGTFSITEKTLHEDLGFTGVSLLYYDSVQAFSIPRKAA